MLCRRQILTNVTLLTEVPYPSSFRTFMDALNLVNFDFIPWQLASCAATTFDYYTRFLVTAILPLIVMAVFAAVVLIPICIGKCRDMNDDPTRRLERAANKRKFLRVCMCAMFLVYPGLSARVLSVFVCKEVQGTYYLASDFSLQCYDERWNANAAAASESALSLLPSLC